MPQASRLIVLGVITSPHGVRGQVKIRTFTEDPHNLTAYGPLCNKNGRKFTVHITSAVSEVVIASIDGSADRNQAELLRGTELCVPRSALPKLPDRTYYHEDLVGIKVSLNDGTAFGVIEAVHNYGAGDIIYIKQSNGKEELFPLNKETFPTIDIENATAIIVPPEMIKGEE